MCIHHGLPSTYVLYLTESSIMFVAARMPITKEGLCQAWLSIPYLPISEGIRMYKVPLRGWDIRTNEVSR